MRFNELIKKLKSGGWRQVRTGKSSLIVFKKNDEKLIIHNHGSKEVPTGTADDTLKKAGLK